MPTTGPSAWNIANYLTILRLLLVPVFGWLLLVDDGHERRLPLARLRGVRAWR